MPDVYLHHHGEPSLPPLLCLHGIGSCAEAFIAQHPLADELGLRLIAWDAPGYRRSAEPDTPPGLDGFADAAAEVIDRECDGSAVVLGVSWGGVIATRLTLRHPEKLRALVLADSSTGSGISAESADAMRARSAAVDEIGLEAFARSRAPRLLSKNAPEALVTQAADYMIASVRQPTYSWAVESMAVTDHTDRLGEINVATLVLVGEADIVTPPERAAALAAGIRGAELVTIPNAGHLANQERPDLFNAAVRDFIERTLS